MSRVVDAAVALASVRPDIRGARRQLMLSHAKGESGFGYVPPFDKTPDGSPSHNWGAIYASGDKGTFQTVDTSDGKVWYPKAAWNSSAAVGARQYASLIQNSYPEAYETAGRGDAWGFAKGLWRKGPGSSAPPYYEGFPPGHKWSLAPKDTVKGSAADYYYRILAYAKFAMGNVSAVAGALGEKPAVFLKAPPPPKGGGSVKSGRDSGGAFGIALAGVAGVIWARSR